MRRKKKKENANETADTNGEGVALPDPQGAGVPAWDKCMRRKEGEKNK